MPVRASIEFLAWESAFFGLRTARLHVDDQCAPISLADFSGYGLIQAKIAAQQVSHLDALSQIGFQLVEGEVDSCLVINEKNMFLTHNVIPFTVATQAMIPELKQCANQVFSNSRFRTPWFHESDSGRFYAMWVEKAVLGTFDHTCLVVNDEKNMPLGFVTLRHLNANEVRIGLLATFPCARGKGVGKHLMAVAWLWCLEQKKTHLRVATQISNIAALQLYARCGAVVANTAYWLYRGKHDPI